MAGLSAIGGCVGGTGRGSPAVVGFTGNPFRRAFEVEGVFEKGIGIAAVFEKNAAAQGIFDKNKTITSEGE